MKRNQALPSKYLGQEDFPNAVQCEIAEVVMEEIEDRDKGITKTKAVLYVRHASDRQLDTERGLVLNCTNWDAIAEMRGESPNETDTDEWIGMLIVLYKDANVMFGKKKVGGVRIRAPKSAQPQTRNGGRKTAPAPEEEPPIPF